MQFDGLLLQLNSLSSLAISKLLRSAFLTERARGIVLAQRDPDLESRRVFQETDYVVVVVTLYRVVQLNLTPEIEVFYMLFDRSLSLFTCGSRSTSWNFLL